MSTDRYDVRTLAVHAGFRADAGSGSVAVPIHQTTSYQFQDTEHAANLFELKEMGHIYTRVTNPTVDVLEQRLAAIEGGVAALATSSGQAAIALAVQNITQAGDNIVSGTDLYGGTWNMFRNTLSRMGIEVRFVDPSDPDNFRHASDAKTRAWFAESLPNPKLTVLPIAEVAQCGREQGIPLIVDNTAAPIICQPLRHGAAIVVHSCTKYIGGHGTSIGGVIIDGGNFDWVTHRDRFPGLNEPDPSYHGAIWTEAAASLGPIAFILKARVTLMRDLGPCLSPFNAFQLIQGIETLPLRMREHCRNAQFVANYLASHPQVSRVIYPAHGASLASVARERTERYLHGGRGGLVGFELRGGKVAGRKFIDSLRLVYHVANIGDARTLAIHPASSTHQQLSPSERCAAGVSEGFVRLSVGIEDPSDILDDIDQALRSSASVADAA